MGKMVAVLTLFVLLPVVLGANPYRKFLKDATLAYEMQNSVAADSNVCPNGYIQCPTDMTCCATKDPNEYSCCPEENAVCCSMGMYCCPEGYQCNNDKGTCVRNTVEIAAHSVEEGRKPEAVTCPDHTSQCPSGNTCCKLANGDYACCPLVDAVCCSDHKHCCPHGYTCDVTAATCTKVDVQLLNKKPIVPLKIKQIQSQGRDITCPDNKSQCPSKDTCCLVSDGEYGCCPQQNATCCADKKHCCPHEYICDKPTGTCMKAGVDDEAIPLQELVIKTPIVLCPDGEKCPDGDTCCLGSSGAYGCCPVPNAVCCSDHKSCCPAGYTCDVGSGTCTREAAVIKTPTKIVCPDGGECPDGNTCCLGSSGAYACCPVPNAVCCSDHKSCCPAGYICDVGSNTCSREAAVKSLQFLELIKSVTNNVKDIVCPGNQEKCPNGDTCCITASGAYGCCPEPNAVCCSDHVHCCPSGFTCDVANSSCTKSSLDSKVTTDLIKLVEDGIKHGDVECPNGEQSCPGEDTCCLNTEGGYSCCPDPNAVCCSDHLHCCPSGYSCNIARGACYKSSLYVNTSLYRIPFLTKSPTTGRL